MGSFLDKWDRSIPLFPESSSEGAVIQRPQNGSGLAFRFGRGTRLVAYEHKLIAEAVGKILLAAPRTTLGAISKRLEIERHTIRRAVLGYFGLTFRELQQKCLLVRASAIRGDGGRPHSAKEVSFALGFRSATSLSRLMRRARRRLT